MTWPIDKPRVRVASTGLKDFSGNGQAGGFGFQDLWIVPYIHGALTNQSIEHRFPDVPTEHDEQIVYWEGAYYLITLALGWSNPGRGLKWWFEAGKPTDEPVLYLLSKVWDHRNQLERLAAWLWFQDGERLAQKLRHLPGSKPEFPWNDQGLGIDRAFGAEVRRRWAGQSYTATLPLGKEGGGSNELHMGHVFWMLDSNNTEGDVRKSTSNPASATITLAASENWYGSFCELAQQLPSLGDRSWHVDVIVKGWGWLGTYRQSRDTGIWFLGKHSTHLKGN